MTVATDVVSVDYIGNGATTAFAVPFPFLANAHLVLTKTNLFGAETVLTEGVHYTLAGAGETSGGTATLTSALPFGFGLNIRRGVPLTQETSFTTQGTFSPALHERSLDKLTMVTQQLQKGQTELIDTEAADLAALRAELEAHEAADIAAMAALRAELAGSGGGGGIGDYSSVLSTGSTTPRYLADRFAEVRNVLDFGAVGDGVTNDAPSIQAAINAAQAAGGGIVFLPAGVYAIACPAGAITGNNAALTISESNVELLGVKGQTVLRMFTRAMQSPATDWEVVQTSGLAAWQASHAYSLGAVVLANGHEWSCSTAGTSGSGGGPALPGSPVPVGGEVYVTDGSATWRYRDHMFVGHMLYIKKGINQNVDYLRDVTIKDVEFDGNAGGWPEADYPLEDGILQPWTAGGWTEVTTGVVFDMWNEAIRFDGNLIDGVRLIGVKIHANRAEGVYYGGSTMTNLQIIDCDIYDTGGSCISCSAGMTIAHSRMHGGGTLCENNHLNNDITYFDCDFYDAINGIVDGSNTNITSHAWGRHLVLGCRFRNISIRGWTNAGAGFNYEVASSYWEDCGYASADCEAIRVNNAFGFRPENIDIHHNMIVANARDCLIGINVTGGQKVRVHNNFVGQTQLGQTNNKYITYTYAMLLGTGPAGDVEWRYNRWVPKPGVAIPHTGFANTVEQITGDWDETNQDIAGNHGNSSLVANGTNESAVIADVMYVGGTTDNTFNVVPKITNAQYQREGKLCRITSNGGATKNYAKISASSSKHVLLADRYLAPTVELIVRCNRSDNKWHEVAYQRVVDHTPVTANDLELDSPYSLNELAPVIEAYNTGQVSLAPSGATNFNNWSNFLAGVPVRVIVNGNVTIQHDTGGTKRIILATAADFTAGGAGGELWLFVPKGSGFLYAYEIEGRRIAY